MPVDQSFLSQVAARINQPVKDAGRGRSGSILVVAAGSYGFSSTINADTTMPTGFDPGAAALFESIVEAAYLVATADGVFDDAERAAFESVVLEACRGAVQQDQLDALLADLADQLTEDGIEQRIDMIARSVANPTHQREVLRIAVLLAYVSGGVSESERSVVDRLACAFQLPSSTSAAVLEEVKGAMATVHPEPAPA